MALELTTFAAFSAIAGALALFGWWVTRGVWKHMEAWDYEPTLPPLDGRASFAQSVEEIKRAGLTTEAGDGFFICGWPNGERFYLKNETGLLIFGAPGTSKTVGFIQPTILENRANSLIILDPSAENILVTGEEFKRSGGVVKYVNFAGVKDDLVRATFGAPVRINELACGDINNPIRQTEIIETAGVICPVRDGDKQPHFALSAQDIIGNKAIRLCETEGAAASWPRVAKELIVSQYKLNQTFADFKTSRFARVRACGEAWHCEIDDKGKMLTPTDGMRDVFSTMRGALKFLLDESIADMFGASEWQIRELKQQRHALFVIVPESENEDIKKCTYLLLRACKAELAREGGLTTLWLLDEMAASLPAAGAKVVKEAALIRKYRNRIAGICQSYAQFEVWAGGAPQADALRGLMSAAYYGAVDPTSIKKCMEEAGQRTVWQPTTDIEAELGIQGGVGARGAPLLTPEDIRGLIPKKKQLLFLLGAEQIVRLPRTSYLDIPELAQKAGRNPHYDT